MKLYRRFIACGLLAGATTVAHAQATLPLPLPALTATLDTVAVTGSTRVLTLAATPGDDAWWHTLTPNRKVAVFHAPPAGAHEYDLTGIRVLVSKEANLSDTGRLLVNLLLPDSSSHTPSARALLPAPIAVNDREVRRAKNGVLTLDVRAYGITLPATGVFVVAEGAPKPPYRYLGDTLFADWGFGKVRPSLHVRLAHTKGPGKQRLVNTADFICVRDTRATVQPQTWDYDPGKAIWARRQLSYPNCPQCIISNSGLELVVREL